MIKLLNFIAKTTKNCILLILLIYSVFLTVHAAQSLPGVRALSGKQLRNISKYIRPLKDIKGNRYCSSSSVKYGSKSYTLTNMHCCYATDEFERGILRVGDSLEKILFISRDADICILTSSIESKLKVAKTEAKLYDPVLLFGYPRGGDLTPRFGHVLVLHEPVTVNYGYGVYLTVESNTISTLTFPGNSGSAVFNSKGEVVNILYAGPNPLFLYGITVTNKQIHKAFEDMLFYSRF